MAFVEIRIPQLGEGLQEARIVRFLKQPGDPVKQDEPIYEMETDKAVMEIESPAAGVLVAWDSREDDVLPIGAIIGRLNTTEGFPATPTNDDEYESENVAEPSTLNSQLSTAFPTPTGKVLLRAANIPPRTKAYAKAVQLSDGELTELIRTAPAKLMPEDIDRYLESKGRPRVPPDQTLEKRGTAAFEDILLPQRQKTLVYRLQQATREVVPATMEMRVDWSAIEATRAKLKEDAGGPQPSQFILFAWCVAQASKSHPKFRSALCGDSALRQYKHLNLGIAVALENDELLLARVDHADSLHFVTFVTSVQSAIQKAREGVDQASETMQLSLTNMASQGVRTGIPVIAAPAAGTLFIGEPFDEAFPLPSGGIGFRRMASMVLSFDHRIANGVGAANFLSDIRRLAEKLDLSTLVPQATTDQ